MRMAQALESETVPVQANGGNVIVPPQDVESQVDLARAARAQAFEAATMALDRLTAGSCTETLLSTAAAPASAGSVSQILQGQHLASFVRQAHHLIVEATEFMAERASAISDAQQSRQTDAADAEVSELAAFASRAAAAHALVGGEHGLNALRTVGGPTGGGFFPQGRLSAQGARALEQLRASAISPDRIADTTTYDIDALVYGSGDLCESARARLAAMSGRTELFEASSPTAFYELLGVSREGFVEARDYLFHEQRAFDRSPTHPLPVEAMANGEPSSAATLPPDFDDEVGVVCNLRLYAATRNPPHQPVPIFWTALLRYDSSPALLAPGSMGTGDGPEWLWGVSASALSARRVPAGFTFGREVQSSAGSVMVIPQTVATGAPNTNGFTHLGMLASIAERSQRAIDRIHALPPPPVPPPTGPTGAALAEETLAAVLGDIGRGTIGDAGSRGIAGRGRACVIGKDTLTATIRLDIDAPGVTTDDLIVVTSHESLDCAVHGSIERAPCTPAQIELATPTWSASAVASGAVRTSFDVPLAAWGVARPALAVQTAYVLRRRPGYTGNQPGGFVEVAGWALQRPAASTSTSYLFCDYLPISEGVFQWAAHEIMPSESYAATQAASCAGLNVDNFRLPLENELTDDLDGRESSWIHYLRLAEAASLQSDMLAETLIDEGLQMDLRAEGAVDALEQICGVRIDVSPTERIPSTTPWSGDPMSPCPTGYFRHDATATTCALDPVAWAIARATRDSDAAALARCLGTSATDSLESSFVGIGDTPLCLWQMTSDESTICQQEVGGLHRPCPFLAADAAVPCAPADMPPGATPIYVPPDRLLHLFHVPADPVPEPPSPSDLPCAALAQLRADPLGVTLEQAYRFRGSSFLSSETFRNYVRNLRWEATAGDYSRVYAGNSIIAATGSPSMSEGRWPVGDAPFPWLCPPTSAGFTRPAWTTSTQARLGVSTYTGPLFCVRNQADNMGANLTSGLDDDLPRWFRASMNDLLARAVIAAHVVTGESLEGSRLPYYPPAINCEDDTDFVRTDGHAFDQLGGSASLVFESGEGRLLLDHHGDPDADGDPHTLTDLEIVAQRVVGHSDWTVAGYDRGDRVIHSFDPVAVPTPGTRNLPMLALTLGGDDMEGISPDEAVARLWGELPPRRRTTSFIGQLLESLPVGVSPSPGLRDPLSGFESSGVRVELSQLTGYYPSDAVPAAGGCWHREGPHPLRRNPARPADLGFTSNDILNGIELACMGAQRAAPDPISYGCDTTITIDDARDVRGGLESRHALRCLADRVSSGAARSVVRGLPASMTAEVLGAGGSALGTGAGDYGAQVAIIRGSLLEMQNEEESIAAAIRVYANSLEQADNAIRAHEIGNEIANWELASSIGNHITNCVVAAAEIVANTGVQGLTGGAIGASVMRTAAVCGNGIFQTAIATRIRDLRTQTGALEIESALLAADTQFVQTSQAIREHAVNIRAALSRIDAAVTQLRSLQGQGRTALARALFLDDTPTGTHLAVDTVMHRRFNMTRVRYEEARTRAVRTAFIARLALEQRLGMNLSSMTDNLVTVDAPSGWADELCTLSALDYEALRDSGDETLASPDNYAGYYIGDYVRRLEQVFESYSFAYPFQDGTDRVVLSLRDDVKRVTSECDAPVPNLLLQTQDISTRATDARGGWEPVGCGTSGPCITTSSSGLSLPAALGASEGVVVRFGAAALPTTRYAQAIVLPRGRYRLAWWAADGPGSSAVERLGHASAVRAVMGSTGAPLAILNLGGPQASAPMDGWTRYDYFFDVAAEARVDVSVLTDASSPGGRSIAIAGLQLERATGIFERDINAPFYSGLSSLSLAQEFPPGPFYPTTDTRIGRMPGCRDDGTALRRGHFVHRCELQCADGRSTCADRDKVPQCWFETSFQIDEASLSQFVAGTPTGFASGNYNYRVESIGINLVGTALRQCSSGGSGCFASGNFSYSLLHQGDTFGNFAVRNALDVSYPAPLHPGRIEGARALAAERYLTNPISGADEALITPYMRTEFQGRPLAGTVTLRIHDEPTLSWDRLEDVQIVLNYRYWTHQR